MKTCPCCSEKKFTECCEPLLSLQQTAQTAEQLMRSRYSAFAEKNFAYLKLTTDPMISAQTDHAANEKWAEEAQFTKLEILSAMEDGDQGLVEFEAHFTHAGQNYIHHEKSLFRKASGLWYYNRAMQ